MPDLDAGDPARPPGRAVGLIQIDDALLALDVAVLREVIHCPASLSRLPSRCEGIIGALTLRGTIIPVLDLGAALGLPARRELGGVVIILRLDGRVLGLLADAIFGMAVVTEADLQSLTSLRSSDAPRLTEHGFRVGDRIASLLDGKAIAELRDVPMVTETEPATTLAAADGASPYLLFDYAGTGFGIDAICVEATVPRAQIQRNSLTGGACLGVINHQGLETPIVDTHAVFGLGPASAHTACEAVVVRFPMGGTLALTIDAVRDIPRVPRPAIKPLPPIVRAAATLLKGMLHGSDGKLSLLIDEDALRAEPHLSALSRLCRPKPTPAPKVEAAADTQSGAERSVTGDSRPYLVYTAGEVQTTPLVEVSEILPYPSVVTPLADRSNGLVGLYYHRGIVVPLIHLASYLGFHKPLDRQEARILVMEHEGQCVGFIIDALQSVEPGHWRTAPPHAGSSGAACERPMVLVGPKPRGRLVWRQDLRGIMRTILETAGPLSRPDGDAQTAVRLAAAG